jgi:hypothetical protein
MVTAARRTDTVPSPCRNPALCRSFSWYDIFPDFALRYPSDYKKEKKSKKKKEKKL